MFRSSRLIKVKLTKVKVAQKDITRKQEEEENVNQNKPEEDKLSNIPF